jgi:hypothetical protein
MCDTGQGSFLSPDPLVSEQDTACIGLCCSFGAWGKWRYPLLTIGHALLWGQARQGVAGAVMTKNGLVRESRYSKGLLHSSCAKVSQIT